MENKKFTTEYLQKHWANGTNISLQGKKFRVGRMSYGDYFFEPGLEKKETEPFNIGTLWLEKISKTNLYKIIL